MLEKVKECLGITGTYQDIILQNWITEIQQLMIDGGIPSSVVNDIKSAGVIARGVDDVYFQKKNLSSYFWQRATQLAYKDGDEK